MTTAIFIVALVLLVGCVLADYRSYRRRTHFDRVVSTRTLVPHAGDLRAVAWRAVNISTPAAPRELAGQELR